jgi:catechol 2,3-dioxygenase-like lactoylglutathione lyase family enzyme
VAVQGLNHYNLRAQRVLLDTLRDFYVDVVGLTLGFRPAFASSGYWLYAGDKDILHLTEAPQDEHRPTQGHGTVDHVAFTCSDAESFRRRLLCLRVDFTSETTPSGQLQLFLKDPADNGIELNFASTPPNQRLERP